MLRNFSKFLNSRVYQKSAARHNSVEVFINGRSVQVPSYFTIMQALKKERVTIPSFCYHERLSISGNCRMCLVEVEGWWKPQIACAVGITKGMRIRTNTPTVNIKQESVLEFLLINHPLDCPICDQGGECDLQDLSMLFGNDRSRFTDLHFTGKRAVEDKTLGPLIRGEMNRCIHCTRCIRFSAQVCGVDVLGTTGRGNEMLVGTYVDKLFLSELSGNIIDLCPVGALTAIPYKFKARPWELSRVNSIDVTDAIGTNIAVSSRFNRVLRILPREHDEINQEWMSDKGRWTVDSLEMQRLVQPLQRQCSDLCPVDWEYALNISAEIIKSVNPKDVMAIAGPHCSVETLVAAKDFLNGLGSEHLYVERDLRTTGAKTDIRGAYSMCHKLSDVAKADRILLVGTNPRFEAPILNMWIRQAYRTNECDIYAVGPKCDYNYHVNYVGSDLTDVEAAGKCLKGAKTPLIFIGISQLEQTNADFVMSQLIKCIKGLGRSVSKDWGVLNVVTREASFCGALEAGWKPGARTALLKIKPNLVISLGADDIFYRWTPHPKLPIIYIGFQGDKGAKAATMVLPGSAYTEAGGVYMNIEGRAQVAMPAVSPPGMARHDWKIIRALAECCCVKLNYDTHNQLRVRMEQVSPNFKKMGQFQRKMCMDLMFKLVCQESPGSGPFEVQMKYLKDYYCSEIFSANSVTMVKAEKAAKAFEHANYNKI